MTRGDISSLAHSKWNCKYHVVFAPKYRRMVIYSKIRADIGKILRKLCVDSFFATLKKEKLYQIPTYRMKHEEVKTFIFRYIFGYYNT